MTNILLSNEIYWYFSYPWKFKIIDPVSKASEEKFVKKINKASLVIRIMSNS